MSMNIHLGFYDKKGRMVRRQELAQTDTPSTYRIMGEPYRYSQFVDEKGKLSSVGRTGQESVIVTIEENPDKSFDAIKNRYIDWVEKIYGKQSAKQELREINLAVKVWGVDYTPEWSII